jgi:hypothetical protein
VYIIKVQWGLPPKSTPINHSPFAIRHSPYAMFYSNDPGNPVMLFISQQNNPSPKP